MPQLCWTRNKGSAVRGVGGKYVVTNSISLICSNNREYWFLLTYLLSKQSLNTKNLMVTLFRSFDSKLSDLVMFVRGQYARNNVVKW